MPSTLQTYKASEYPHLAFPGPGVLPDIVPQVVALDYDRSLVDVDESFQVTCEAASEVGINSGRIAEARMEAEQNGDSFYPFVFIEREFGERQSGKLLSYMGSVGIRSRLRPDAARLLHTLKINGIPRFLLSHTIHIDGQYAKVISSAYDGGLMFVTGKDKGRYQETFSYPETDNYPAGYRLHEMGTPMDAAILATEACLVDDDPGAFENWNGPGFFIFRHKEQKGALPTDVRRIDSLDELTVYDHRLVHVDDVPPGTNLGQGKPSRNRIFIPRVNPMHPLAGPKSIWTGETL